MNKSNQMREMPIHGRS